MVTRSKTAQAEVARQGTSGSGTSSSAPSKTPLKSPSKCRRCGHSKPVLQCSKDLPSCAECSERVKVCSYIPRAWMETALIEAQTNQGQRAKEAETSVHETSGSFVIAAVARQSSKGKSKGKVFY